MNSNTLNHELLATDILEHVQNHPSFLDAVVRDDTHIDTSQSKVLVPESGTLPQVSINAQSQLSVENRSDIVSSYLLESYRTRPIVIRHFEQYFVDYEKQKSISSEQALQLKEALASHALHHWSSAVGSASHLLTSGSARGSSYGTGNRKAMNFSDLLSVKKRLVRDVGHYGEDQYIGLVNAELYGDLMGMSQVQNGHYTVHGRDEKDTVLRFLGIRFYLREDLPRYSVSGNTATIASYGSNVQNTHCAGALFFNRRLVRAGIGNPVNVYADVSASYGGLTLSSEIKAGASAVRTDGKGIMVLVENTI